jgi:hypothetical protein
LRREQNGRWYAFVRMMKTMDILLRLEWRIMLPADFSRV